MRFVKMHGLGNDYVYLDAVNAPTLDKRRDFPALARAISDRHTGVGSDGLIVVCPPSKGAQAHVRMRMFNADGSEAEMCGNGIRCVAKFAYDRLGVRARPMLIQTGRGVMSLDYSTRKNRLTHATVDMGEPIVAHGEIGARPRYFTWHKEPLVGLETGGVLYGAVLVSMGNPHAVIFQNPAKKLGDFDAAALRDLDLARIGPALERHRAFTHRANIHFVAVTSKRTAIMRTWERGSGITQACGTGACGVLVAGVLTGRLARKAKLTLPGGPLEIEWNANAGHVLMTGPATEVFEGEWSE
jgi:diaminopimelate epimerase